MGRRMKDLTGQRFDRLVAIRPTENRDGKGFVMWLCHCDCGNEVEVSAGRLTSKKPTRSCGCLKVKDLTGQRFDRLVAIRPTENRSGNSIMWLCRCDCGNEVEVSASKLQSKHTRSCGCLRKEISAESIAKLGAESAIDFTGQRFDRLVAIRPTENRSGSSVMWLCHCDCGNEVEVSAGKLQSKHTRSCGCLRKEISAESMTKLGAESAIDLTGQRFDRLIAIHPTQNRSSNSIMWLCRCDCGNKVEVSAGNLQSKGTRSCGCLQKEMAFVPTLGAISPGYRSGKLEAISPTNLYSGYYRKWECRCDCGNTTLVSEYSLIRRLTKSCGCISTKDHTGQRFDRLVAIRPTENRDGNGCVMWLCHCDCGNKVEVSSRSLTRKKPTRSCGCLKEDRRAKKESDSK